MGTVADASCHCNGKRVSKPCWALEEQSEQNKSCRCKPLTYITSLVREFRKNWTLKAMCKSVSRLITDASAILVLDFIIVLQTRPREGLSLVSHVRDPLIK